MFAFTLPRNHLELLSAIPSMIHRGWSCPCHFHGEMSHLWTVGPCPATVGQGFIPQKISKIHGFFGHQKTCINHSDQGEVPELDGAFNGKVIDLNEGFPASHVSVPEGMIQHVRLKHNSFRLMTFHSCKNNSLDFEASRSGPGKVFFSTENCH